MRAELRKVPEKLKDIYDDLLTRIRAEHQVQSSWLFFMDSPCGATNVGGGDI